MFIGALLGAVFVLHVAVVLPLVTALVVVAAVAATARLLGGPDAAWVAPVTTFITRYDTAGNGTRLAVKDLIDMEGEPTTAGCRAVANAPSRPFATPPAWPGPGRRGRASWGGPTCMSWPWG